MTMFAPDFARACAIASPMPEVEPVTMAVLALSGMVSPIPVDPRICAAYLNSTLNAAALATLQDFSSVPLETFQSDERDTPRRPRASRDIPRSDELNCREALTDPASITAQADQQHGFGGTLAVGA